MSAQVSIIVPVLSDADAAARLLEQIPPDPDVDIVLVDGGADVRLDALAAGRDDVRLVRSAPGRSRQMNAGAAASSDSEWLWFLHADSRLPPGWKRAVTSAPGQVRGGWFRFALDDPAWQARCLETAVRWRVRLFRLPYGDQGMFVRRSTFDALGGFRDLPLMEDVEFARRLVRAGPVADLPLPLRTSSRRWRRDGWVRRSARNLGLLLLYFAGVSPHRLAAWYAPAPVSDDRRRLTP
jgi:rSAM/selenodomain-associated transferase 2